MIFDTIDYDKIYECKDGKYRILKEEDYIGHSKYSVRVRFEESGIIQEVNYRLAISGRIRLMPIVGNVYKSNGFGNFIFKGYVDDNDRTTNSKSLIEFIDTGTQLIVCTSCVLDGSIKDNYRINICGVACMGYPKGDNYRREYVVWYSMIARCYDINNDAYRFYGAKGVTVCERWLCFEYFFDDVKSIAGYWDWYGNPGKYQLDKDKYQNGILYSSKIYSPETCCFINKQENLSIMIKDHNMNTNTASNYTGVSLSNEGTCYRASITINGKKHGLGTYETEQAAANVYNNAVNLYCKDERLLNDVEQMDAMEIMRQRRGGVFFCKIASIQ